MALADQLGMHPLFAHCHFGLGKLYLRTGERDQAQEHLGTAVTMYSEMDMRFWLEQAEAEMRQHGPHGGPAPPPTLGSNAHLAVFPLLPRSLVALVAFSPGATARSLAQIKGLDAEVEAFVGVSGWMGGSLGFTLFTQLRALAFEYVEPFRSGARVRCEDEPAYQEILQCAARRPRLLPQSRLPVG